MPGIVPLPLWAEEIGVLAARSCYWSSEFKVSSENPEPKLGFAIAVGLDLLQEAGGLAKNTFPAAKM